MQPTAAARLAASFRAVKEDQALSGAGLAERVARLTGVEPSVELQVWVSRRLNCRKAMITIDPDLFILARALEIPRNELIAIVTAAIFGVTAPDGTALTRHVGEVSQ